MNNKQSNLDLSARVQEQVQELKSWLGEDEAMREIEAAISDAWRGEGARRYGHVGVPWVVQPGARRFASEADAIRWLQDQGAEPVGPGIWSAYDESGAPIVWELAPLRSAA